MTFYLSFSSRPIPGAGEKSMLDGVLEGDPQHLASECLEIMKRIPADTPKRYLPAFANAKFKGMHKKGENWLSCNVLHIDIDKGLPANAEELLSSSPYSCFFYQTPSSKPELLKYRVYVFLDRELTDTEEYVANYDHNCDLFLKSCGIKAESDRQTKDAARFMYISARPDTFRAVLDRARMPFDTAPRVVIANGVAIRKTGYHASPTRMEYDQAKFRPLMRAKWLDFIRNYNWREGEKHLRLLMLASRGAGYEIPYAEVEAELIKCLPSTTKDWNAAKGTILYGYLRPRYPDYYEMLWLFKRYQRIYKWNGINMARNLPPVLSPVQRN